ncbi:hypothetical protein [Bacillus sp. NPDC093026]
MSQNIVVSLWSEDKKEFVKVCVNSKNKEALLDGHTYEAAKKMYKKLF